MSETTYYYVARDNEDRPLWDQWSHCWTSRLTIGCLCRSRDSVECVAKELNASVYTHTMKHEPRRAHETEEMASHCR
jgi:hypothetical protein